MVQEGDFDDRVGRDVDKGFFPVVVQSHETRAAGKVRTDGFLRSGINEGAPKPVLALLLVFAMKQALPSLVQSILNEILFFLSGHFLDGKLRADGF